MREWREHVFTNLVALFLEVYWLEPCGWMGACIQNGRFFPFFFSMSIIFFCFNVALSESHLHTKFHNTT